MKGGHETFLWALDSDPYVVETMYLTANRYDAARSLGNIPKKDQPSYEDLEHYTGRYSLEEDLAFSDRYPQLLFWLNDYSHKWDEDSSEQE